MILDLPLAHIVLDAATADRGTPGLISDLMDRSTTRIVLMDHEGRLAVAEDGLAVVGPDPELTEGRLLVFLGYAREDSGLEGAEDRAAYLLAIGAALAEFEYYDGRSVVTTALSDPIRAVGVSAVAIANWHRFYPRCGSCGEMSEVRAAGWVRYCPACRMEHFPRTDTAVIMAVLDAEDRVLLAHAAHFPERRYSVIAGYVEPGESLESAVVRETLEEVGLTVTDLDYRGSQPWPFPRSLMCSYTARVEGCPVPVVDGEELTDAGFYSREDFAEAVTSGALRPPGPAAVAHAMLTEWYGAPLPMPPSDPAR